MGQSVGLPEGFKVISTPPQQDTGLPAGFSVIHTPEPPKKEPQSTLDTFLQFSGLKGLKEAVTGAALRAGQTAFDLTANERANTQGLGVKPLATEPRPLATPAEKAGGLAEQVGELFIGGKAPAKAIGDVIPNAKRAEKAFDVVMSKAKDIPIDTAAAEAIAARAHELSEAGHSMPKVIRKFLETREPGDLLGMKTAPEALTYKVGRDFASKAGQLSAQEATKTNRVMKKQVAEFAAALKTANREAAEKVGMGKLYDAAMKEYKQVKQLETLKKYAIRAAAGTAVGTGVAATGASIYNLIRGR